MNWGWKGRGLWTSYNPSMSIHTETRRPAVGAQLARRVTPIDERLLGQRLFHQSLPCLNTRYAA